MKLDRFDYGVLSYSRSLLYFSLELFNHFLNLGW